MLQVQKGNKKVFRNPDNYQDDFKLKIDKFSFLEITNDIHYRLNYK